MRALVENIKKLITIIMTEINDKELTVVKSQVSKLENQAAQVSITTPEENESAMNLKAKLKEIGKDLTARKEEITKPLNTALKSARELFAPMEIQLSNADKIIGAKLISYKQKVDAEARAKEAAIAKKVEEGKMKLETAEKKLEKIEETKVEKTTRTDHGTVQFRKIKKVRVVEPGKVPGIYWQLNEVLIRKDALLGVQIPGVEVYEEETV